MWDVIKTSAQIKKYRTNFFIDWLQEVNFKNYLLQSEEKFIELSNKFVEVKALQITPQSAPWHSEGPTVAHHIKRILAGLFVILDGNSILKIEELNRHKILKEQILRLEQLMFEHAAVFEAYAFVHDLAKAVIVSFDAKRGSLGEKEGFFQHHHRETVEATKKEKEKYLKLFRAEEIRNQDLSIEEMVGKFFDKYEIKTHFYSHAEIGSGEVFETVRENIYDHFRLITEDRRMLNFIIKYHIKNIQAFKNGHNVDYFKLLRERAIRAGLNANLVVDFSQIAMFLDSSIGEIIYRNGMFVIDTKVWINFLYTEHEFFPSLVAEKKEKNRQFKKKELKKIMKKFNLSAGEVFSLLKIPFGPERKGVIENIESLIQNNSLVIEDNSFPTVLVARIEKARQFFDQSVR